MTDRPARNLDAPPLGPGSDKHERPTVRPLVKIQSFMRETSAPESDSERGFPAAPITQRRLKGSQEDGRCTEPARMVPVDSSASNYDTIDDPIAEMRERFSLRDYEGALALADRILTAWPDHALASEFRATCCAALEDVYAFRLGPMVRIPVVVKLTAPTDSPPIDHRTGFLLSFIDGSATLEALVDRCGLPKSDVLRILDDLMKRGFIVFE
jgi:IclR-like helix-turn-helix domain-containing protein